MLTTAAEASFMAVISGSTHAARLPLDEVAASVPVVRPWFCISILPAELVLRLHSGGEVATR